MSTVKSCLTVILICIGCLAKAQYNTEARLSLNSSWRFKTDPNNVGEKENWANLSHQKNGWELMKVPGNWDTHNEYSHYAGKAWYQKTVVVPQQWRSKKIYLNFDGVYFDSKVWLNGKLLGTNNNGFLPFQFNVSELINRNGENSIVVCADNTFRLGAVWNWGGIRRAVTLVAYNDAHIAQLHITPKVDLQKGTADIAVKVYLQNEASVKKHLEGVVELGSQGVAKTSVTFKADIAAHAQKQITVNVTLDKSKVHLWHFDDPFLYDCVTSINESGKALHQLKDRFGLRTITVDNKNYSFKLNGEPVRLMGFNLVPDDRTTGNTLPLWRIKADVDDMKALGCNMARLTHFPLPKEMYDYLDERGILVFPEVPLWGAEPKVDPDNQIPKEWLKRLIDNNYNHPCIIGWSVGNEIGHNPLAMPYVKKATELARSLDPSHLAVVVSHTADRVPDITDYADLGLVNKYSANLGPVTQKMHLQHPDKLLFYSEYGTAQTSEDLDTDLNAKTLLDSIRYKPYLMGASLWTYNDYRSNYLGTKGFTESRPWGVVNDFRQRKKAWYSIQKEYSPLRACQVASVKIVKGNATAVLNLTSRSKLDLPAYTMKNYRVVWQVKDKDGQVLSADFINLPVINPGDQTLTQQLNWAQPANAATFELALVSPLNYALSDTTIYFIKPATPVIKYNTGARTQLNDFQTKTASIRVVFERSVLAQGYKVRYGQDKLISETPVTGNNIIDINGLDFKQSYNFSLVAINAKGESELALIEHIYTNYAPAPPLIKYTEPADQGAFIGYESLENDYVFNVRYTTVSGDYTHNQSIQSTNKGALFIPNLVNGKTYYFEIQRLKQNSYPSPWSEEVAITPDGGQLLVAPVINAVIQKEGQALILFTPVKKSTGYLLKYRILGSNDWKEMNIRAAQINQYLLSGLSTGQPYEFKLAAINETGVSNFSTLKK